MSFRNLAEAEAVLSGRSAQAAVRPIDELAARLLRWTVLLLPINWICGTTPLWLYGVAVVLLFGVKSLSILETLFLWLIGATVLGLAVGLMRGAPMDRALASIYNMTVVVVLIAFLNAGRRLSAASNNEARGRIYRAAWLLFVVNALFVLAVFGVTKATGQYALPLHTFVLGLAGNLPGVLGEYGQVDISVIDWTVAGPETRVVGFGIYATEGALLFLLLGLLAGIDAQGRGRMWRLAAIEGTIVVGLIIMASRTTLLAYVISALLFGVLQRRALLQAALLVAPVVLVGGLLVMLYGGEAIGHWLAVQNDTRLGSSGTRFLSYTTAIDMVLAQNPLTGLGIKPMLPDLMLIPVGSHSTLTSTFIKGGFVALAVLACLYVTLVAGVVRAQFLIWLAPVRRLDPARKFELLQLARCVVVILVWWVTEDFDAPAHEAAMAGMCFGLFWGCLQRYNKQY